LKEERGVAAEGAGRENARLKKIVAVQALDISLLTGLQRGNGERDPGVDAMAAEGWRVNRK
jgi:hypothetical protein